MTDEQVPEQRDGDVDPQHSQRPYRKLCTEAEVRDAMSDGEFWEHVFRADTFVRNSLISTLTDSAEFGLVAANPGAVEDLIESAEFGDDDPADVPSVLDLSGCQVPCPVCGARAECGTDGEGRPLIHAVPPRLLDAVDDDRPAEGYGLRTEPD
jgi:hypothetical protein